MRGYCYLLGAVINTCETYIANGWNRDKVDVQTLYASSIFEKVDLQSQQIISALLEQSGAQAASLAQITALIQLVCRLDGANQDEHRRTREVVLEAIERRKQEPKKDSSDDESDVYEDIATYKLTTEIDGLSSAFELTDVSDAQESQLRNKTIKTILRSLQYERMTNRYEDVVEAYPKTFEWIFCETEEEQLPWDSFTTWLETGDSVYWISGKAGSGKSTLMKHIFDDHRTRRHLRRWANCRPLCIASFFFWGSGTAEQRSQSGCLKALLFQILDQHPELIPIAMPGRWAETYTNAIRQRNISEKPWSLNDLMAALRRIVRQTSTPLGLCFLVDGLDEFDGDHEDIVELFKDLALSDNFKACLSSRPWVIFKEAFFECSSLLLQNFTYKDIVFYVTGRFHSNISFKRLRSQQPEAAVALIKEVVDKADGVFLWVRLAVKSLLNGIQNRDDVTTLRTRLKTLPRELEALYVHLLNIIEPHYLPWTSKVLQIVRACRELGTFYSSTSQPFIGVVPLTLGALRLALEDTSFTSPRSENLLTVMRVNVNESYQDLEVHLAARAAGLLEVSHPSYGKVGEYSSVGYLHLTCRDYLESPTIWPNIVAHTAKSNFNPCSSMLRSCIKQLKLLEPPSPGEEFAEFAQRLLHSALIYASRIPPQEQVRLLDELNIHCTWLYSRLSEDPKHWSNHLFAQGPYQLESFLDLATIYQLSGFVGEKLKLHSPKKRKIESTSLLHKLLPKENWGAGWPGPTAEMVAVLLSYGADPNHRDGKFRSSVYENTILYILNSPPPHSPRDGTKDDKKPPYPMVREYLRILPILLTGGANPYLWCSKARAVDMDYRNLENTWKKIYPEEIQRVVEHFELIPKRINDPISKHDLQASMLLGDVYVKEIEDTVCSKERASLTIKPYVPPVWSFRWLFKAGQRTI